MDIPKVSFIIPVYNGKKYIETCLNSIVNLSFSNWECIIVDDGSTDDSGKYIDTYVDKISPKGQFLVIHKKNGGVSTARNTGLDMARGEWICFVDIDDCLSCDFICANDFETEAELYVKNIKYNGSKELYHPLKEGLYVGIDLYHLLQKTLYLSYFLCPWAKLFRRDIIERNGIRFNPKYSFGEDTLFVENYLKYVNTLNISPKGNYIYEVSPYNKYSFSVAKAIDYMQDFADVFFKLGIVCPEMAKRVLIWHSGFCSDFKGINKFIWYTTPSVNKLYRHSFSLFPTSMKLKICVYYIISLLK